MSAPVRYRGANALGIASIGSTDRESPAVLMARLHSIGWRWAVATRDGTEVGGITRDDAGKRVWWGEDDAPLIGPHEPSPETDLCCAPVITCGACERPVRLDGSLWRADIDGLGAEIACYPPESEG